MFEKFRFDLALNNVYVAGKQIEKAKLLGNHKRVEQYQSYAAKQAEKAIKINNKLADNDKRRNALVIPLKKLVEQVKEFKNVKQIKNDLEGISTHFDTLGEGTEVERYAQLAIQDLEVAYRRLDKIGQLKLVYFEMGGKEMLPPKAKSVLEKYVDNKIDLNQARHEFEEIISEYKNTLKNLGINPTESKFLFGKFPPKDKPNNSN